MLPQYSLTRVTEAMSKPRSPFPCHHHHDSGTSRIRTVLHGASGNGGNGKLERKWEMVVNSLFTLLWLLWYTYGPAIFLCSDTLV